MTELDILTAGILVYVLFELRRLIRELSSIRAELTTARWERGAMASGKAEKDR